MGLLSKPDTLLQALDDYFDKSGTNLDKLGRISKLLNTTTETTAKIQHKFTMFFSYTNSLIIKKFLDLLEYLTFHSTAKLPKILNTEPFIETLSNFVMEFDFQDDILNLLRIWSDKYGNDRAEFSRVFDFIENLQNFDIYLPAYAKTKYEGVSPDNDKKEDKLDSPPVPQSQSEEDRENIMANADKLRNKTHSLLADPDFDIFPQDYRSNIAQILIGEIEESLEALKSLNLDSSDIEGTKKAQTMTNDLEYYKGELFKKVGDHQPTKKVYTSEDGDYTITGPEPDPEQNRDHGMGENFPQMMSVDELLKYKTNPCEEEMRCKFAPVTKKGFQLTSKKEIQCKGWHGMQDRRRGLYDMKGNMMYKAPECREKDECVSGNNCKNSHNWFEFMYHPQNYKSKKCSEICNNGRYCPYFHSKGEQEAWKHLKKSYLNLRDDEEILEDDEDSEDDIPRVSNVNQQVRRHLPLSVITDIKKHRVHEGKREEGKSMAEKRGYHAKVETIEVKSDAPKDKELYSKLVIRKKYVEVGKIGGLLVGKECFNGVPLFLNGVMECEGMMNDSERKE